MINLPSGSGSNKGDASLAASGRTRQLTPTPTPTPPDVHFGNSSGSSLTASAEYSASDPFVPPPPPPPPPPLPSSDRELAPRAVGESARYPFSAPALAPASAPALQANFGVSSNFDADAGVSERERERGTRSAGEAVLAAAARPASQRAAATSLEGFELDDADTKAKYTKRYPFYMGVVRWLKCALTRLFFLLVLWTQYKDTVHI